MAPSRLPREPTVRQTLRILRIALERARGFGLVKTNVAREVATPRVPRPVIVPLSPREVRALLRVTRGQPVGRMVVLGLAGLRAGELRGLQWGDLELRTRRLHVRRTAQWAGRGLDLLPPKTRASVRTIALPRFVVRELARVPRRQRQGLLFAGPKGTPLHGTVLQRWLARAAGQARLGRDDVTVHLLRHTAAAMLLESAVHLPYLDEFRTAVTRRSSWSWTFRLRRDRGTSASWPSSWKARRRARFAVRRT